MPTQNFRIKYFPPKSCNNNPNTLPTTKTTRTTPKTFFYHSYGSNGTAFYPYTKATSTLIRFSVDGKNGAFRKRSPEWIQRKTPFSYYSVDGKNGRRPRIENVSKVFHPHYTRKTAFSNVSTLENVFEKLRFCRPHYNRKTAFSYVSTLESVFKKLRFHRPHYNRKTAFSNVSTLGSVFEKLLFPPFSVTEDAGLVWTKGLTVSKSIRFQTITD